MSTPPLVPTDSDPSLLTVVATITARPETVDQVEGMLTAILEPTRAEDGCVAYTLHQGAADPTTFVFYEVWRDQAALAAHSGSPALKEGLKALGGLVAAAPVIVPLTRIG